MKYCLIYIITEIQGGACESPLLQEIQSRLNRRTVTKNWAY